MEKRYYKEYYELERNNWWFKARLDILEQTLQKKILTSNNKRPKILNAGAATGATSVMLKKYGDVTTLEYDKDCAEFLEEILNEEIVNESLTELSFEENTFDIVCAFDVIEHIDEDSLALSEINRVLKDNGTAFITVPAFMSLWGKHDLINHHFRRYTSKGLSKLMIENNFQIQYNTYFNFFLFPPVLLVRLLNRGKLKNADATNSSSDNEMIKSDSLVNSILHFVFRSERHFINNNIKFPFGVSFMTIANKSK